ncbi:MAG TPA: phage holin family protein, partial [Mobilitalea sp.]|nr:phage holin family protein [Mobilitalea sp.]
CLCLGYIIKHSITMIPNKYIPLIMAISGVILNLWLNDWSFTPEILLGGLVSGLASTGTHQMIRNIIPKDYAKATQGVASMSLRKKRH